MKNGLTVQQTLTRSGLKLCQVERPDGTIDRNTDQAFSCRQLSDAKALDEKWCR